MIEVRKKIFAGAMGLLIVFAAPAPAFANTAPNEYEPSGESWIDVDESDKVHLENFGSPEYDDESIHYVGAEIECTSNSVTAEGPFLTSENLDESDCTDSLGDPFDPIDSPQRDGAIAFGFTVNFFGTEYDSAWPDTNGGIYFDSPASDSYDLTMAQLASYSGSSVMYGFGADLQYFAGDSNFWTAQTTLDGDKAVIFAWEKFHNCCVEDVNDPSSEELAQDMSFQIVLIDVGEGDFNAYFNYSSINGFNQGYYAKAVLIDLATGVTPTSNIFISDDAKFTTNTCTLAYWEELAHGQATDEVFIAELTEQFYYKLNNISDNTVSIWADEDCVVPIQSNVLQDVETDGHAFIEFDDDSYESVAAGWATLDPESNLVSWTELLRNVDAAELADDSATPLISRSLNTEVPGRFVIGQREGQTVVDSTTITPAPAAPAPAAPAPAAPATAAPAPAAPATITPTLAATGANVELPLVAGLIAVIAGSGFLSFSRRQRNS